MFDLYNTQRLVEWRNIRNKLEEDPNPLERVASVWSKAPFVNPFLNPKDPSSWPDPWQLVLGDKLDELAIALGILYTIKLTDRFIDTPCEIHMSMPTKNLESGYFVLVDKQHVLNYEPRKVVPIEAVNRETEIIWEVMRLQ